MYIDKLLVFLVENVFSKLYAHASMLTEGTKRWTCGEFKSPNLVCTLASLLSSHNII